MANLPKECRAVLDAPGPVSAEAATFHGGAVPVAAAAPEPEAPSQPATPASDSGDLPSAANAFAATPRMGAPVPRPRPPAN